MKEWVREDHKSKALVLEGPGGIGKTQLAMALLLRVRQRVFFIDDYEQVNQWPLDRNRSGCSLMTSA